MSGYILKSKLVTALTLGRRAGPCASQHTGSRAATVRSCVLLLLLGPIKGLCKVRSYSFDIRGDMRSCYSDPPQPPPLPPPSTIHTSCCASQKDSLLEPQRPLPPQPCSPLQSPSPLAGFGGPLKDPRLLPRQRINGRAQSGSKLRLLTSSRSPSAAFCLTAACFPSTPPPKPHPRPPTTPLYPLSASSPFHDGN